VQYAKKVQGLRLEPGEGLWRLAESGTDRFGLINERLRGPSRLPRALKRIESADLPASPHCGRGRAMAGLMLFCGLRSTEVLALQMGDVDIGARWLLVQGKGTKERRVPLDVDVAGVIQTYLLAERPETTSHHLFMAAKGPTRGGQ
jgi:integrase/recombinase XerD